MAGSITPELLQVVMLLLLCAAAAALDLRTGRIPNLLTAPAAACGLALASLGGGGSLLSHAAAAGVLLVLGLPLFAAGALGGGDVKLLAAVGALLGPASAVSAVLLTCAAGVGLALVQSARRGVLLPVIVNTGAALTHWVTLGRRGQAPSSIRDGAITVPYGVAIAVGAAAAGLL